jgi:hypothetical protein
VGSLASRLRSDVQARQPQKTTDESLWQAMLILKLAEMFREEEREIAQGFLAISGREAELFAAIRGDETEDAGDDEEEQALRALAAATTPGGPAINLTRLAKAWGRLFLRDTRAAEFPLLVATQEELQGLLAERYEALTGKLSKPLISLALPNLTEREGDAALVEKFRAATGDSRAHFTRLLLGIAASVNISAEQLTALQGAGNALNRAALPFLQGSSTEKTMHICAYEGTSLGELFADLCGEKQNTTATTTGLLAVLS